MIIRNLDDRVAQRLRVQARLKGVSVEQEARRLLAAGTAVTRREIAARALEWVPTESLLVRAAQLAVEIDHPVYDCVYLVLSSARGARLATADAPLRRAAATLGVRLWAP